METINGLIKEIAKTDIDAILITSESNIAYLTGFSRLEGVLLITKGGRHFCLTDSRYIEAAQKLLLPHGYEISESEEGSFKAVNKLCENLNIHKLGFENECITVSDFERIKKTISCEFISVSGILKSLRAKKYQFEADNIIKAQRIAEKALDKLLGEIKPGLTEIECRAKLEYYMSVLGSEKPSFETIFISGAKTSMPHGVPSDKKIERGGFITIDFGAKINGYCSDMTRTVAVGSVTLEMKKVYDTVLEAQLAGCACAAAGKTGREIDKAARDVIDKAGFGKYFGHSVGHSVGLDIHESPSASPKSDDVMPYGTVLTIEPGIYLPGKFGVRIEDMMYLTENQNINLTNFTKNLIIL